MRDEVKTEGTMPCMCGDINCPARVNVPEDEQCEALRGRPIADDCQSKRPPESERLRQGRGYAIYAKQARSRPRLKL